jgi:hypothetical protein
MNLTGLAALVLAASPLLVGCSSDPTCDDVDDLSEQLADTDPDDPDYNDWSRSSTGPRPTATTERPYWGGP